MACTTNRSKLQMHSNNSATYLVNLAQQRVVSWVAGEDKTSSHPSLSILDLRLVWNSARTAWQLCKTTGTTNEMNTSDTCIFPSAESFRDSDFERSAG